MSNRFPISPQIEARLNGIPSMVDSLQATNVILRAQLLAQEYQVALDRQISIGVNIRIPERLKNIQVALEEQRQILDSRIAPILDEISATLTNPRRTQSKELIEIASRSYKRQDYETTLAHLAEAQHLYPYDPRASFLKALTLVSAGESDKALEACHECLVDLQHFPQDRLASRYLAMQFEGALLLTCAQIEEQCNRRTDLTQSKIKGFLERLPYDVDSANITINGEFTFRDSQNNEFVGELLIDRSKNGAINPEFQSEWDSQFAEEISVRNAINNLHALAIALLSHLQGPVSIEVTRRILRHQLIHSFRQASNLANLSSSGILPSMGFVPLISNVSGAAIDAASNQVFDEIYASLAQVQNDRETAVAALLNAHRLQLEESFDIPENTFGSGLSRLLRVDEFLQDFLVQLRTSETELARNLGRHGRWRRTIRKQFGTLSLGRKRAFRDHLALLAVHKLPGRDPDIRLLKNLG